MEPLPSSKLRYYPDPILSSQCARCPSTDPKMTKIAYSMIRIMNDHNGYGLSAPQVGLSYRIFVMKDPDGHKDGIIFFNPEIKYHSDSTTVGFEGCLSIPGPKASVRRYNWVELGFEDHNGDLHSWKMAGLNARCVQHEVDHLDGILIFNRMSSEITRKRFLEMYSKAKKKRLT